MKEKEVKKSTHGTRHSDRCQEFNQVMSSCQISGNLNIFNIPYTRGLMEKKKTEEIKT